MKKFFYVLVAVTLIFGSCQKEKGCTDSKATNFNSSAEEDDGSCNYISTLSATYSTKGTNDSSSTVKDTVVVVVKDTVVVVVKDTIAEVGKDTVSEVVKDTINPSISVSATLNEQAVTLPLSDTIKLKVGSVITIKVNATDNIGVRAVSVANESGDSTATYKFKAESRLIGNPSSVLIRAQDNEGNRSEMTYVIVVQGTLFNRYGRGGSIGHSLGKENPGYSLSLDTYIGASDLRGQTSDCELLTTDKAGEKFTGSWIAGEGNGAMFVKAPDFDFDNAALELAEATYKAGTPKSEVTNPNVGDIYIVKKDDQYMVLKVESNDPDGGTSTIYPGELTFTYKK